MIIVLLLFLLGGNVYTLLCQPWNNGQLLKVAMQRHTPVHAYICAHQKYKYATAAVYSNFVLIFLPLLSSVH